MRNRRHINQGFTLTEMLVSMAIMTILMAVAIPAAKKLSESMEQSAGVKNVIEAALANARAVAVREQKYAGIRFQQYNGRQYLMFIINDPAVTGLANGFRIVDGRKPVALSENTAIISEKYTNDTDLQDAAKLTEATSASILFTPAGKLTTHPVRFKGQMQFGKASFMWDDGGDYPSVISFLIYDLKVFENVSGTNRWSKYLSGVNSEHISPYTGELIKKN
jgi:prepilin-type N-terminal cleavage/methylation domain-containing protein